MQPAVSEAMSHVENGEHQHHRYDERGQGRHEHPNRVHLKRGGRRTGRPKEKEETGEGEGEEEKEGEE